MSLKSIPLTFMGVIFFALVSLTTVKCFNVPDEGFEPIEPPPVPPATEVQLESILTTSTSSFLLSSIATDADVAQQLCHHHGATLLTVESPEELEDIKTAMINLQENDQDILWTSGIRYSNATVENLLVWSITQEPFTFPLTESDNRRFTRSSFLRKRFSVRNRRSAVSVGVGDGSEDPNCPPCPECPSTSTPPPVTSPLCKRPHCEGSRPQCTERNPRDCLISRSPVCEAKEKNCTVECGTPKDCQVIKQPECTVVETNQKLCRLENSNLDCRIVKAPKCRITAPGHCHSLEVKCKQEDVPCEPIIKPCKNPCSQQECETVQPPCATTEVPCINTTIPCPPPPVDCVSRCRRSTKDKTSRLECENSCNNPPVDCGQETIVCPPPSITCPPPRSSCTRPFVDCSPEICQSSVIICPPPKLTCPIPQIICESPKVECTDPEFECREPEAICFEPEIKCTKPLIKCPDPVVHCNPIVTTCEAPSTVCTDPDMDCPEPIISCGEPTICPVIPITGKPGGGNGCCSGGSSGGCGNRRGKRDLERMENIECIAFNTAKDESEFVAQSCSLKHRFICRK